MKNTTLDFEEEVLLEYCCLRCQKHVKNIRTKIAFGPEKGKWIKAKFGCDCKIIDRVHEKIQEAKIAKINSIFSNNSLVNASLQRASFENFDRSKFDKAFNAAKRYVNEFSLDDPKNMFFQGTFGTGKSHLSYSIARSLVEKGFSVIFISVPKLLTKIGSTYNKNNEHNEEQIIDMLSTVDLVVFDDMGAERDDSSWVSQKLFEVIDQRSGKHNIFTTNLSSEEYKVSKDSKRILSRMTDNSVIVIMNGPDYRVKNVEKVVDGLVPNVRRDGKLE